jgi:DNA-binding PadR family transcriptional regulator
MLRSEWGTSENNRRAKYYRLTAAGRRRLRDEAEGWQKVVAAMASVLSARPEEV